MVFNSYIFITAFLPCFILLFFIAGRMGKLANKIVIILGSAVFYLYVGWRVAALLGICLIVNLILSVFVAKTRQTKLFLVVAILLNVGILAYFKYLNFVLGIFSGILHIDIVEREIMLPLGISYITFQQIMYVVSVWRGDIKKVVLTDYLAFILFFPKLCMGPLMEPADFIAQLNDEKIRVMKWENIASGIKLFSLGLFKKVVLADTFAKAVGWGLSHGVTTATSAATATSGDLFLIMLIYTLQIYFDFSGYSDMAIGIAHMINIDLPMNFNSPYKATSLRDFWHRWHISLSNFLTKYIYFPLGGSRKGNVRTYINLMIVFFISGIWHGSNWTFILWGCSHGLLLVIERIFRKHIDQLFEVVRWGFTFLIVMILWLMFISDSMGHWLEMLSTMFQFKNMAISSGLINSFTLPENAFLINTFGLTQINENVRGLIMIIFVVFGFLICLIPENNCKRMNRTNPINMILCAIAFVWAFLCLSSESVFLYFNF